MPMCLMESVMGQYSGFGPLGIWKCCPVAKGIGFASLLTLVLASSVYSVIAAYSVFYMATAFTDNLPWSDYGSRQWWGDDQSCLNQSQFEPALNVSSNGTAARKLVLASQQYWEKYVLNLSIDGISNVGPLQWSLALCLLLCWVVSFLCLFKGIRSAGKVVYFTATFPFFMLAIMLIRASTLEGGLNGIKYFFTPDWYGLLSIKVWKNAAQQFLISLSVATGGKPAFASYNAFHHKIQIDAWITWATDFLASLLASMTAFAVLGAMAAKAQVTIDSLPVAAQGLAFVVFPELVSHLVIPQLWLFLFFFTLFVLRIDNQFCMVHILYTVIQDEMPAIRKYRALVMGLLCLVLFLIGLPTVTAGGQYVIRLLDVYVTGWIILVLACLEVIAIQWIYGLPRFCDNIRFMLGFEPWTIFKISWLFGAPFITISIVVLYCSNFPEATYEDYVYPEWARSLGWFLTILCLVPVPLVAVYTLAMAWNAGDLGSAFRPTKDWGPTTTAPAFWDVPDKKRDFASTVTILTHL